MEKQIGLNKKIKNMDPFLTKSPLLFPGTRAVGFLSGDNLLLRLRIRVTQPAQTFILYRICSFVVCNTQSSSRKIVVKER